MYFWIWSYNIFPPLPTSWSDMRAAFCVWKKPHYKLTLVKLLTKSFTSKLGRQIMLCVTALNQIAPAHVAFGNIPLSKFKTCSLLPQNYACCSMISLIVKDIMHNKTSIKHLKKKKGHNLAKYVFRCYSISRECFLESHCPISQGVVRWRVSPSDGRADRMMEEGMRCISR